MRERLRILCDPIYIQISNLSSSSTYHRWVNLICELVKRGHFVYWMIPEADYTPHPLESHPQVGVIRTAPIQDQFLLDVMVPENHINLFNRISGKYHIDMVITQRTGMANGYKESLQSCRFHDTDTAYTDKSYGLPVCIIEGFPQTKQKDHISRAYALRQHVGYFSAEMTFFQSDHNREAITKEMLDVFRSSLVDKWIAERTTVLAPGIKVHDLDRHYDPERYKVETGFNVLSIGRIFGQSYAEYLPWFDYLYKAGQDVSLTISLSGALGGPMRAKLMGLGFDFDNGVGRQFKVMTKVPKAEYLPSIKRFHAFICPVSHYDHPTGLLEAIYLGVPGVIPVSDYQRTFFPDWPWVIKPSDKAGMLAALNDIRENPEEARAKVLPWRDRIRGQYDATVNNEVICDEIEKQARQPIDNFKTSSGVVNLLKDLKGTNYTFPDVIAYLRTTGRLGVSVGDQTIRQTFTYARAAIHHALNLAGYVDTCDSAEELFVRRDIFERDYLTKTSAPIVKSRPSHKE